MKENNKSVMQELGPYLGLGAQLAATIVIMAFIGKWLDDKYAKSPLFLLIFSFMGIIAGMYNLIKTVLKLEKNMKK